jgi:hypothetical protein
MLRAAGYCVSADATSSAVIWMSCATKGCVEVHRTSIVPPFEIQCVLLFWSASVETRVLPLRFDAIVPSE